MVALSAFHESPSLPINNWRRWLRLIADATGGHFLIAAPTKAIINGDKISAMNPMA
jgi:hypothetical protein